MTSFAKIELGNNDFRNQRIQVSKNSYVTKNQAKMPMDVTFWFRLLEAAVSIKTAHSISRDL